MRDLNECQAEVFRRSEKRIKRRKQRRKHILMACIPLVLCITMFSAFILPDMMPAVASDNFALESAGNLYVSGSGNDAMGLSAGTVEVSGTGVSHYYSSVEDVQEIMGLINGIVAIPETDDGAIRDFVTNEASTDRDEAYEENGYSIIVTRSDGTRTEYLMLGSLLIDQNTKEEFSMDEKTYFELKDALGISLY